MKYFPKIIGERLYLSPMSIEDLETYTKWINDPAVSDGTAATAFLYSVEKERDFLESAIKSGDYIFAVIKKEGDILIGNVGLHGINHIHRTAECGIFIGEEENRNKGYGVEALTILLNYGFGVLNINNIMLKVFSFNAHAMACYKKIGFKEIGRRRDSYFVNNAYHDDVFMDILAEEFYSIHPILP